MCECLCVIGGVKRGPAIKIYTKLKKDVVIKKATWMELPQPKLKLETWGMTKMYHAETVIEECSLEQVIQLLRYVNPDEEKSGDAVQGVFAMVVSSNQKKSKSSALEKEDHWQDKVVQAFRDLEIDGHKLMNDSVKEICNAIMNSVVPLTELNERGRPRNVKLRGGVNQVLRALKSCYVHGILTAAAKQQ